MSKPIYLVEKELMAELESFPVERRIPHCGREFGVSPFAFYATCPSCGTRMKLRRMTAYAEVPDVFEAVFEWLEKPGAVELAKECVRQKREEGLEEKPQSE